MCYIDPTGTTWKYVPTTNKMVHKGKRRVAFLGPIAQAVLADFMPIDPTAYVFESPKKPGHSYTVRGYSLAVHRACMNAGVDSWHPHQLRHSHATLVRDKFGLEAAQASLSHARAQMTEHYAEKSDRQAAEVARQIG
jgi:integrase